MKGLTFGKKVLVLCSLWCVLFPGLLSASSTQEQQQTAPPPRYLQAFWNLLSSLDCKPKVPRMSNASKTFLGLKLYTLVKKIGRYTLYKLATFSFGEQEGPVDSQEIISSRKTDSQQSSYQQSRLLLSGDVELNPGPGRLRRSPHPVSNPDDEFVHIEVHNPPAEPIPIPTQVPEIKNTSGLTVGVPAHSESSSKSIPGEQVVTLPSPSPTMSVKSEPNLLTRSPRYLHEPLSSSSSTLLYKDKVKARPSLALHHQCISADPTADDCLVMLMSDTKNMTNDRITLENKEQYAKNYKDSMNRLLGDLQGKGLWSSEDGFQDMKPTDLFQFYLIANQIIVYKRNCEVCLLCGKRINYQRIPLPNDSRPVFPRILLEAFSSIHGEETAAKTNSLEFVLFCPACEEATSKSETKLRDLYVTIMDPKHQDDQIEVCEPYWLFHTMISIIYRGILTTNLFDDLHLDFTQIIYTLATLRSLVANPTTCKMKDVPIDIMKQFGLYILPNGSCSLDEQGYLLSQHLRLPQPTSVVRYRETVFLYTTFDCFHCVLKYNDIPSPEIDLASNCFSQVHSVAMEDNGVPREFILIPASEQREKNFPKVFVEESIQSALTHQMSMLISRESDQPLPLPTYHCRFSLRAPTCTVIESTHIFEPISENECTKICSKAKTESPFCQSDDQKVKSLTKENTAAYEQIEHIAQQLKFWKQRGTEVQVQQSDVLQQLRIENRRLISENEQLKDKIAHLESKLTLIQGTTENSTDSEAVFVPPLERIDL